MAVPAGRPRARTTFKKSRVIAPLYTAGPVALTPDGKGIVTCVGEDVLFTEVCSGIEICKFSSDTSSITAMSISPSASHLCIFTSQMSLRIYELPKSFTPIEALVQPIRVNTKAHDAHVHVCKTDPTSTYLASGSADGVVKVWDIVRGFVTHVFKGHGGIVSALAFNYPQDPSSVTRNSSMQLITASSDTRLRIFELSVVPGTKGSLKPVAVLEGHVSVPRGLDVSLDGKWLISGGRDSVVLVWNMSSLLSKSTNDGKGKGKAFAPQLVKTIPALDRVEAVGLLHPDEDLTGMTSGGSNLRLYTAGESGVIKVWDGHEGIVLFTLGSKSSDDYEEREEQRQIVDAVYIPSTSTIVSIHADQNILFHSLSSQSLTRQLIGFNDEIVDATLLSPLNHSTFSQEAEIDTHLALATNSSLIRIYSVASLDARLLEGHSDTVLSLDRNADGSLLASSSKDRSARIWVPSFGESDWGYRCAAICKGHTESVGALAFSRTSGPDSKAPPFLFTGSQDRTIKMWDLSDVLNTVEADSEILHCKSLLTLKAHEKDINSLDVSPNNKLLVSGSQDRLAKIYTIEYTGGANPRANLKELGICKGHKRGVWTVCFGRTEKVLATGSGDKTIKLWNLEDFSCVKTFEGHTNSVLRVDFLNLGTQLVSTASDGLVKLWNIMEEECVATLDNHEDKVWALAISTDEKTIVSGAADSIVTFWKDCTEEHEEEEESKRKHLVEKEQEFQNYLSLHDYRKAIQLALAMEQPGRLLNLFKQVIAISSEGITGKDSVDEVIRTLAASDLTKLLSFVRAWNSNAKTSIVAQTVLHTIFKLRPAEHVISAFNSNTDGVNLKASGATALKDLIDSIVPYTERHLSRIDRLVQESYMVDYILSEMDDGMIEEDTDAMDIS